MKSLLVALQHVALHPEITSAITGCAEHLPDRVASTELSADGVQHLCLAFPIRAVRVKRQPPPKAGQASSKYVFFCVGGLRTYQIAKARLPPETKIRILVQETADDNLGASALRELFLGAVVFGIRGSRTGAQLEALRKAVPAKFLTKHFPRIKSRTAMTEVFGFGRSALSARADEGGPEAE